MGQQRPSPRQNRADTNSRAIADATARGDSRRVYVLASQWVMAEVKAIAETDPRKAAEIYEALAKPLISAAERLNRQTWRINA